MTARRNSRKSRHGFRALGLALAGVLALSGCSGSGTGDEERLAYDAAVREVMDAAPESWVELFVRLDVQRTGYCEQEVDPLERRSNALELMLLIIDRENLLRRKRDYDLRSRIAELLRTIPDPRVEAVRLRMDASCRERSWIEGWYSRARYGVEDLLDAL